MMNIYEERLANREALLSGNIPKRVPIHLNINIEAACGYADVDQLKAHYDLNLLEKAYSTVCNDFYTDTFPIRTIRFPLIYQVLGAKNWIMGSTGVLQHPEIEVMTADDYDEFITDPFGCLMDKFLPRLYKTLDTDQINKSLILAKTYHMYTKRKEAETALTGELSIKYGYVPGTSWGGQQLGAPFDFLADLLRGFKQTTIDLRRRPEKVKAACEAILPLMMKLAIPPVIIPGTSHFIPLHLAPFINMNQFETYYWPTFKKMLDDLADKGIACHLFVESDWTRFSGYLASLPESARMHFERSDPAHIKETVGEKHVIGGFYDPTITLTRSTQACIDEAKRLIDICAPGGRYFFCFDKGIMDIKSVDVKKVQAVLEWVRFNTDY